jgi:HPt (histidine-containing phosphotransfer) domain-containing protein
MTDESPVDLAVIARLEEWGGPTLRVKMMELFITHGPERLEGIRKGLEEGDDSLADRSAHSLKSSCANLGAEKLRRLAGTMETAMERKDRDTVRELLPEAQDRLKEILEALQDLLSKEQAG